MRVQPSQTLGIVFGLAYIPLFIGVSAMLGGSMADMGSAARLMPFVIALAVGSAVTAGLTTYLGWWPLVLRDAGRVGGAVRAVPWIWAVTIAAALVLGSPWSLPVDRLLATLALAILVGFAEELAYRGLALVGLRAGSTEARAFLVMTFLFAILHLPNVLLGQQLVGSIVQTGLAFLGGTGLYLIRRSSGSIAVAMLFHGAWDFAAFSAANNPGANPATGLVQLAANVVVFVLFLSQAKRIFAQPATA